MKSAYHKKKHTIIAASCALLLAFTGRDAAADTVKIGVITTLTGIRAEAGQFTKNALQIAQQEIRRAGASMQLQFVFEDSQYDPKHAVSAFLKLKNADQVRFIIGAVNSSEALAIAPLADKTKTILLITGAQSDEISRAGDYVFRLIHNSAQEAPFFARFVAKRLQGEKIDFLLIETAASVSYLRHFVPELERLGKTKGSVEHFEYNAADFRPQLMKLKAQKAADIFLLATPRQTGLILKQSQELGLRSQFYSIGAEGPDLPEIAGPLADGLFYAYSYDAESTEENVRFFHNKYTAAYNEQPDAVAANAYDAALLLSSCFQQAGLDSEDVKNCLYRTREYRGASGTFSIDSNGDAVKNLLIKTISRGRFVRCADCD